MSLAEPLVIPSKGDAGLTVVSRLGFEMSIPLVAQAPLSTRYPNAQHRMVFVRFHVVVARLQTVVVCFQVVVVCVPIVFIRFPMVPNVF